MSDNNSIISTAPTKQYPPPPPSIYFGGCCFGAAFYVGVHKAMVEMWGPDFYQHMILSGGSAGTIFAVGISLGKSPEYMNELYKTVAQQSNDVGPIGTSSIFTERAVRNKILDDPWAYKKLEGKCCFGTTAFFAKHRWHISWESNDDLMDTIEASYHIPFYCQKIKSVKGVNVIDGAYGFAGIDLPHGDETLYVGIDPHAEITRTFTNTEMFYPAVGQAYIDMVESGYLAMMKWDGHFNKKVGFRRPNYEALYVLWFLKGLEQTGLFIYAWMKYIVCLIIAILRVKIGV